jgi:hypothetical protein
VAVIIAIACAERIGLKAAAASDKGPNERKSQRRHTYKGWRKGWRNVWSFQLSAGRSGRI